MSKAEPRKLYAVSIGHQPFAADLCWGSCGKGQIGALALDGNQCIPCNEEACPHLDQEAGPVGTVDDVGEERPVYLRKLEEP